MQCRGSDDCPLKPETVNGEDDEDGCPDVKAVLEERRIAILEPILFVFNKTGIKRESYPILDEVIEILRAHPDVKKVRVEGHTDARGAAGYNRRLSTGRAKAVMRYLVRAGISKRRLSYEGFGEARLLVRGATTEEERARNRRVEFVILEQNPVP